MELIKHECGIAMLRLRKPTDYYAKKYGTSLYGLNRMYLMMEKEHNRGQEGAGLGCVKLDATPGEEYIFRERAEGSGAIQEVFGLVQQKISEAKNQGVTSGNTPFVGDVYMGHLRYSTTGRSGISYVHPFLRRNNWRSRNMLLCGNFNLANVDEIYAKILSTGQHPRIYSDTFLLLEQLGHALDRESERLWQKWHETLGGLDLSEAIARDLNVANILHRCAPDWDGGYVICGIVGNGDMWVMRDPKGIRPAYYYADDEVVVVASERPVIQTAFNLTDDQVKELPRGAAIIVDRDSSMRLEQILPEGENCRCSFERIYFSRGNDKDIYNERKELGKLLVNQVVDAVDGDIDNTVLSFIPNTAEVAFYGLSQGVEDYLIKDKIKSIEKLIAEGNATPEQIEPILKRRVRREKAAWKDIKLRTFIAEGESRDDLAAHVYDITYDIIKPGNDNLVVIDDSIVRGTTLKQSIIRILDRLHPRRIVIVSSSPQVRYPDCYGIDMSRMGEFCAFRAAIALLKESGRQDYIDDIYRKCKAQESFPKEKVVNYVKEIYAPFSDEEISDKIAKMLTPEGTTAEVKIVYQSLENLHKAIPDYPGDWYFSGDYPTPGGTRLLNKAFINYYEGNTLKRD